MILKSARLSVLLPVLLAFTFPAVNASAETKGKTRPKTTTTKTGTATTQVITGTDPTPIEWPPKAQASLSIE